MKDIITKYLVSSLVVTSLPSILIATLMCDKFVDWREKNFISNYSGGLCNSKYDCVINT